MEIEGMIIQDLGVSEGVSKANKPWKKHEWVLETLGQYPRKVKFTVFGDRVNTITFELGKKYVVMVDVESREYSGRWYTDLTAYNCREVADTQGSTSEGPFQNSGENPYLKSTSSTVSQQTVISESPFGGTTETDFTEVNSQDDLPF